MTALTTGANGRRALALVVALATIGLTGCQTVAPLSVASGVASGGATAGLTGAPEPVEPATGSPTSSPGSSTSQGGADDSGSVVPAPAVTAPPVADALRPTRVALPSIAVDAPIIDLGIAGDGHVQVPSQPQDAGWLATSPAPGQRGPAVILGHVDSTSGPAVFYPLRRLAVGDPIVVTRRDGSRVRFTVDGVRRFAKADFPTQATYGPVPGPALRLITCDGPYDRSAGGYQDNLVVFAS